MSRALGPWIDGACRCDQIFLLRKDFDLARMGADPHLATIVTTTAAP